MSGDVIKSFLVSLGFGVDEASLSKFNKSISNATLKVAALYGSIQATATGIGYGIAKISESFEELGYEYKILAPAINKALILRQEMMKAYSATGVNLREVIQNSVKLNISLTKTRYAFEAIYKSVASRFFTLITKQSDIFRQKLYANMPKIQATLEKMVHFVFKALEATINLGVRLWSVLGRVYEYFSGLHERTNGWSTAILGLIALWKILNLSFLATPLGAMLTAFTALLVLFDDFATYQEGGNSLIDWSRFIGLTDGISKGWEIAKGYVEDFMKVIMKLDEMMYALGEGNFKKFFKNAGEAILLDIQKTGNLISRIQEAIGWKGLLDKLAGVNQDSGPIGIPNTAPSLSSQIQNSNISRNITLHQQNTTHVNSVADANATGKDLDNTAGRVLYNLGENQGVRTR